MNQEPEQCFETKPNLCFGSWIKPSPISSRTCPRSSDRNSCGSMRRSVRCSRKSERPSIACWPINVRAHHAQADPKANTAGKMVCDFELIFDAPPFERCGALHQRRL